MQGPLKNLDQWDDFVQDRYDPNRKQDEFRQHTIEAPPVVQEFYRQNHTHLGIYEEGCGLNKVDVSWGHDEYLYHVVKDHLPDEALYMIRYHSFYPWHQEGAYHQFMDDRDKRMLPWVKEFNPYDLYSKSAERPDVRKVKPFYDELIAEYFPAELRW